MRRSKRLLELIKFILVVLALQIALDSLEHLLHALKARVKSRDLVPCSELLEEFTVPIVTL